MPDSNSIGAFGPLGVSRSNQLARRPPTKLLMLRFLRELLGYGESHIPSAFTDYRGANYGVFAHLPLELYQQILVQAFGNRTLHIDLIYGFPLAHKSLRFRPANKAATRSHCGLGNGPVRDTHKPIGWQWFSCVCHRRLTWPDEERCPSSLKARIQPWEDVCLRYAGFPKPEVLQDRAGLFCLCESDASGSPNPIDCFIGAMGWLLTSRQAYVNPFPLEICPSF